MINFTINVNIYDKKGGATELYAKIKEFGYKKPLVICDSFFLKNKYIKKSIKKIKYVKYIQFYKEPTYQQLDKEIKKIRIIKKIDCIIGIGGGSALDFAKGIALLYKNSGPSIKYMGFPKNINQPLPVIAIPTTTSTGSEIIYNAVFTDEKTNKKLGINYKKNIPVLSILDLKLIRNSTKEILYQSAIASLMRSIETFTSVDSNFITKFYAKESFQLIYNSLIKITKNDNFYRRLQWGGIFSMFSLSNSSGGPCGAVNYYLSSNKNISQALSYNFSAIEFFNYNVENNFFSYCDLINKRQNKINSKIFIKKIRNVIKLNSKKIYEAKNIIKKDKKIEISLFNFFKKYKFLPLKKNPINIDQKSLKKIIHKIIQ
jgi:alcohol dehydrogenase class IV